MLIVLVERDQGAEQDFYFLHLFTYMTVGFSKIDPFWYKKMICLWRFVFKFQTVLNEV